MLIPAVISAAGLVIALAAHHIVVGLSDEPFTVRRIALFVVLVALTVCANRLPVRMQFRAFRIAHVWDEVPLVLGLAYLHVPDLVIATCLGGVVAHFSAGRGVVKSLYNAGVATLGAFAAVVTLAWLAPDVRLDIPGEAIPLLLLMSLGYFWIKHLAISAVVSGMQRVPLWPVFRERFILNMGLCLTSGIAGTSFVLITGEHLVTLLVLPFVVLAVHGAQTGALRVMQEREAWERLDLATRELNRLNRKAVLDIAVTRATELFRCDGIEVLLEQEGPGALTQTAVGAVGGGIRDGGSHRDRLAGAGRNAGAERPGSVVSRTLVTPGTRVGELRLYYTVPVLLSERESWALSTFGYALTAALINAALYEELQEHANRKAHEAAHDALTGLANRTVLTERGAESLASAVAHGRWAALFLVDLDHFKQVNDLLGHDVGDELLRETGRRLVAGVRPSDLVVRLGGDEFALLLPDLAGDADVAAAHSSVQAALEGSVTIDGTELETAASVGVACAPRDGVTVPELLRCADAAMYRAKAASRSVPEHPTADLVATRRGDQRDSRAATTLGDLHPSLRRGELEMHYQPKVDLRTGATSGAEALARWRTPSGKLLDASFFVPIIEASTLVGGFARQVLDRALAAAANWTQYRPGTTVAVNLSARDLLDRSLPGDVAAGLERHGVDPRRLILEITETVMMSELDIVDDVLTQLRRLGVQLSVDDFGTGFSSLTFLSHVDVQELKVDQSFVGRMLSNPVDATIVETLLGLGRRLGMRVVAEGVENSRQRDHLAAVGCDCAQGYFLGPPMSSEDLESVLAAPPAGLSPPVWAPITLRGRG
ncbi:MAG: EAL domain-containing protein [Frankiaceae bacterium]